VRAFCASVPARPPTMRIVFLPDHGGAGEELGSCHDALSCLPASRPAAYCVEELNQTNYPLHILDT
jgi:hypothetical protein